jgi:subtilisin family serine protease
MSRKRSLLGLTGAVAFLTVVAGALAPVTSAKPTTPTDYLVLLKGTAVDAAARSAITKAGGTVSEVNTKIGYAYVRTTKAAFADQLRASGAVAGVAKERVIGSAPRERRAKTDEIEKLIRQGAAGGRGMTVNGKAGRAAATTPEPLADLQWDMRQIGATATGSYARSIGRKGVRVGIIDTGVDGSHPDIKPNFNAALSRNFVVDMPDIDGPCEVVTCVDPADVDDDGHGTHVASTIGSPINGLGIAGVAPGVTLVNIRAGQDSGYFFLRATLDALTYAGDIGVDVVNMSFYTDPWLFNCVDNPADTPAQQAEQKVIREATQRALNYARNHGVLPVAAMGNEATDLNAPTTDTTSPDYPAKANKTRAIDNSCITVPTESRGVVAVSATGPTGRKSYYSNYGTEQTDVAAPGGDVYDTPTNGRAITGAVLAAYPEALAKASGVLNPDGSSNNEAVVRSCNGPVCGYYQYLQGTSMASPHAVGVAALVVSRHGTADRANGGLKLSAQATQKWLYRSAQPHPCPQPRLFHYTRNTPTTGVVESDQRCAGPTKKNGFYGRGIVNAYRAVTG